MAFYDQLGSFFTGESEEERRRREEEEERLRIERETPVKQTIEIDPVTGAQKVKIEGSAYNLSSANPLTPTLSMGPVAPVEPKPEPYVGTPGFNPAAAPVSFSDIRGQEVDMQPQVAGQPTMPAVPAVPTEMGPPREAMMPEAPAMVPAVAPAAATGAPAKSQAQLELERRQAQQPTTAPTAEGLAMGPSMSAAEPEAWTSKIEAAKTNPQALAAINADTQAPGWARSIAAEELGNTILRQRQEQQAGKKLETIIQNNGKGMERAIKDPSEEGSVFRAYLYQRFGLNDLAKQEQQKLGAGDIYQTAEVPGGSAVVRFSADGQAKSGVYASGEFAGQQLSPNELLQATGGRALGKGATVSSEVYVDKTTGQRYRSGVDASGRAALINVQGGAAYRGDPKNLEVQSIGTSIAKAEGAKAVELRYTGPIAFTKAGADFIGKFNAENGTNLGYASQTPGAPLIDRNTGQQVTPSANGTIRATTTTTGGATTDATGKSPVEIAAINKVKGEQGAKDQKNQFYADSTYGLVKSISDEIKKSTGSGIGAGVDKLAGLFGKGTTGAQAIAKLEILSGPILNNVPRFEGPQSDRDVAEYKRQAGDFANAEKPIAVRLAALDAMITILKKYDKAGTNDWSFGEAGEVDRSNPLLNKKK